MAFLAATTACNSTKSADTETSNSGAYTAKPSGGAFYVDPNASGEASGVRITRQFYGRLVTIENVNGMIVHEEFVVDPRSEDDWDETRFELQTNEVTGQQTLVIKADHLDTSPPAVGSLTERQKFITWLREAGEGIRPIADNGFIGTAQYTMVPRNAAIVLQFNDLIDPATLNEMSVRVLVDEPTVTPFEARKFLDPNHGDLADYDGAPGREFYSTRLIIDPAISEIDSFNSDPPVAVNTRGLPASIDVNVANVEIRIPTIELNGQVQPILQNPTGHGLTTSQNGTFDFGTPNREVVRAFRSGGRAEVTGDPSNGFLPDETPPKLVGSTGAVVAQLPVHEPNSSSELRFRLPRVSFNTIVCAPTPKEGDIIAQVPYFLRVLESGSGAPYIVNAMGEVEDLFVELIVTPQNFTGPAQYAGSGVGPIQYRAPYDPAQSDICFFEFSPQPLGLPADPSSGVRTNASITLRFNEAIDPAPLEPYEGFSVLRQPIPIVASDYIPGMLTNDASLQEFTFTPILPFTHLSGQSESYYVRLDTGPRGPRDLAGNEATELPENAVEFTIDASEPDQLTGGRVSRFNSPDEEFPFADPSGGFIAGILRTEWYGNIEYEATRGRVRPRSVVRSQVVASPNTGSLVLNAMTAGIGTTLPVNPLGARTQFAWRYLDFNLPLHESFDIQQGVDLVSLDQDIERFYFSPLGANPVFESFSDFSVDAAHSRLLPDEVINPTTGALVLPQSGLGPMYIDNFLSLQEDPPETIHPRERGWTIDPGDRVVSADGTILVPGPLNQDLPVEQYDTYTWRDTGVSALGGENGDGAPPQRWGQVSGFQALFHTEMPMLDCTMPSRTNPLYPNGLIKTAGLPILFDMKCYPSNGTSSQNQFAHSLAHPTTLPGFRAFSSGGFDETGSTIIVNPDQETIASGGFDPTSTPPGMPTPGVDNVVYHGALDLVTRVSRMHSVFFPAYRATEGPIVPDPGEPATELGELTYPNPRWFEPVVVPAEQPQGTRIEFQYRGARDVGPSGGLGTSILDTEAATFASRMDPYGDFYVETPINYIPAMVEEPLEEFQGADTSCIDGTFQYITSTQMAPGSDNLGVIFAQGPGNNWQSDVDDISSIEADWIQLRVTFISNIATGQFPAISALGIAWEDDQ